MSEPTYGSALARILDVEETELTFRHRQQLTMEDFAKAREELDALLNVCRQAYQLGEFLFNSPKYAISNGSLVLLEKLATLREVEAGK